MVLTGYRADARQLVQCMDLLVLSSICDGTSVELLEATDGGVPAVVIAMGGNPEIMESSWNGGLAQSGAASVLASAIVHARQLPEHRNCMANAAMQDFRTRITLDDMISKYRRAYRELAEVALSG